MIGDCFWSDTPVEPAAIEAMVRRPLPANISHREDDSDEASPVYYVAFSKAPWSDEARAAAAALLEGTSGRSKRRRRVLGIRLLDLAAVDRDLANWSV